MAVEKRGNILESEMHALVNPVNCVGAMGRGLALAFRKEYPDMFVDYQQRCSCGIVLPGQPYAFRVNESRIIINFPTKKHWRSPSQIEWIEMGLRQLRESLVDWGVTSIAIPPVGCGLGGLPWSKVHKLILDNLLGVVPLEIYFPGP